MRRSFVSHTGLVSVRKRGARTAPAPAGATGSPMGLSKSKHQLGKGEVQKKGSDSKSKEKVQERYTLESRQAGRESCDTHDPGYQEKLESEQLSEKKISIPQIVITRASNESLLSYGAAEIEEQKTIKEHASWGIFACHRNPSTVDAYKLQDMEQMDPEVSCHSSRSSAGGLATLQIAEGAPK
ncbi:PREDICTED: spermatogenesis-associated protein 33 [Chrysochloris asiatica]|uniref:Spermatogenesis-associated protein 33 n=1 Tax=Chrysochloris asiatica TaxID=185453 RepID=A0A9B0TD67_CHRAS|nr:PREDICTED: spermatogenesis-associated protein 33 [Chrysochloris asiatica]